MNTVAKLEEVPLWVTALAHKTPHIARVPSTAIARVGSTAIRQKSNWYEAIREIKASSLRARRPAMPEANKIPPMAPYRTTKTAYKAAAMRKSFPDS